MKKIKLGDVEYNVDNLPPEAEKTLADLQYANSKIQELRNLSALLQRAKNSYISSLKTEILSEKSGFLLNED